MHDDRTPDAQPKTIRRGPPFLPSFGEMARGSRLAIQRGRELLPPEIGPLLRRWRLPRLHRGWVSVGEAAWGLAVSSKRILELISNGRLRAEETAANWYSVHSDDVMALQRFFDDEDQRRGDGR